MPVALPLDASVGTTYRVGTALAGTQYILDVRWNHRDEAWYIDILDEQGVMIRAGIKVVLGVLLGGRAVTAGFPLGVLQAVDLTNAGLDAGIDDLGARVQVYFYDFTEFA